MGRIKDEAITMYPSPVVAERIQKIFWDNNLVDRNVAKAIGMERKAIGSYRRGEISPNMKFVRYLCAQYHVDANWLLDIT